MNKTLLYTALGQVGIYMPSSVADEKVQMRTILSQFYSQGDKNV